MNSKMMSRPNKKDYNFNEVFEGARFAADMIKYCDNIEQQLKEAQEQAKNSVYESELAPFVCKHCEKRTYSKEWIKRGQCANCGEFQ